MASTGIRELKNSLSRYVRRVEAGERIAVTAHGRIVAVLGPPSREDARPSRITAMVQAGVVRPPLESGDPLGNLPAIRLKRGSAEKLLEADRDGS